MSKSGSSVASPVAETRCPPSMCNISEVVIAVKNPGGELERERKLSCRQAVDQPVPAWSGRGGFCPNMTHLDLVSTVITISDGALQRSSYIGQYPWISFLLNS